MNFVSQQHLKGDQITTRTKISNRKSMTNFMWTSIFYAGFLYQADDQIPQAFWVKWMIATVQEFVYLGINTVFSIYQVTPNHVVCAFANENSSSFFAFRSQSLQFLIVSFPVIKPTSTIFK